MLISGTSKRKFMDLGQDELFKICLFFIINTEKAYSNKIRSKSRGVIWLWVYGVDAQTPGPSLPSLCLNLASLKLESKITLAKVFTETFFFFSIPLPLWYYISHFSFSTVIPAWQRKVDSNFAYSQDFDEIAQLPKRFSRNRLIPVLTVQHPLVRKKKKCDPILFLNWCFKFSNKSSSSVEKKKMSILIF